jgi:hypothetical protein
MTSSKRDACSIGRSAGAVPSKIFAIWSATCLNMSRLLAPYDLEATGIHVLSECVHGWKTLPQHELSDPLPLREGDGVGVDEQSIRAVFRDGVHLQATDVLLAYFLIGAAASNAAAP